MAPPDKKRRDPAQRLAKRLLSEGRITPELADDALARHRQTGERLEETLIECGLGEDKLLRHLAELYRVQYISTAKLGAAVVSKAVIQLVPRKLAENRQIVAVMLDRKNAVLSVVTADPDDIEAMKEIEIATQVRTVKALVARPAAVKAAIAKFYDGDDFAFSLLRNEHVAPGGFNRGPIAQMTSGGHMASDSAMFGNTIEFDEHGNRMDDAPPSGRGGLRGGGWGGAPSSLSYGPALTPYGEPSRRPSRVPSLEPPPAPAAPAAANGPGIELPVAARAPQTMPPAALPRQAPPVRLTPPPPARRSALEQRISDVPLEVLDEDDFEELVEHYEPPPLEEPPPLSLALDRSRDEQSGAQRIGTLIAPPKKTRTATERPKPARQTTPAGRIDCIGDPFQMAVVLLSLLEGNRKDLRGHSIQTARMVRKVCESFSVPPSRARVAEIAALIHDVGKANSSYHLTAYNVAQFDGHRTAAEKLHAIPARVLESARLASGTVEAVTHMYERYDGQGFPSQLKAGDIPLESRILAICDSYTDLTNNPRNSFRRVLSAQEACEALKEKQGAVFDPEVIDRFTRVILGDELAQQLRSDCGSVLLVDPDVEETTMLELALLEKRYDVRVARTEREAVEFLESTRGIDLVLSEVALSDGSGFSLLRETRKQPGGNDVAFVFFSNETDSAKVSEALEAGAADYLFKPLACPVVVAKIRHLLEQRHRQRAVRGVSGSIEEMSLPDIVQVLHQGRKTCALKISSDGQTGTVFFKEGAIVDAAWGSARGEEGFYAMVRVTRGGFTIDPEAVPPSPTISVSAEMLLLEGLRRLDESNR